MAPNPTPLARLAALTIAGRTFTVNQAGVLCAATVTAGPLTASATAPRTGTLTVAGKTVSITESKGLSAVVTVLP